jgi:glutathione synthase
MNVLFVTDPLPGLQPDVDATVGLIDAAQQLGVAVWC